MKFLEIEHKYVVTDDFNYHDFIETVKNFGPKGQSIVDVSDTYFVAKNLPGYVIRHRIDKEIQQLSLKNLSNDPDVRTEINLDLGHRKGDQSDRVAAFLEPLQILWSGLINKKVWAYYFEDLEVVYYEATFENAVVRCVEIEAVNATSIESAKETIQKFEINLGLDANNRSTQSLFQILIMPKIADLNLTIS